MTGKDVYERAIASLGYTDSQVFKNRAVVVINQIYDILENLVGGVEYKPITSLGDTINLPERIVSNAMVYGVAERLALGEGDGELQQYFARVFDTAKGRINTIDSIVDVFKEEGE